MLGWLITIVLMSTDSNWASQRLDVRITLLRVLSAVVFLLGAALALWNQWVVLGRGLPKLWSLILAVSYLTVLYVGLEVLSTARAANPPKS